MEVGVESVWQKGLVVCECVIVGIVISRKEGSRKGSVVEVERKEMIMVMVGF